LVCPFWTDTVILPPEERDKVASAKENMQAADITKAVAYLPLNQNCQGMVLYAANSRYFDVDSGFELTRPICPGGLELKIILPDSLGKRTPQLLCSRPNSRNSSQFKQRISQRKYFSSLKLLGIVFANVN
jgi:hypothetical protein